MIFIALEVDPLSALNPTLHANKALAGLYSRRREFQRTSRMAHRNRGQGS